MAALITIADLDARGITYLDAAQAQAAIDDASAVAAACVAPHLDDVAPPNVPGAVVAVVAAMVRRGLTNPRGLAQESIGDYSYASGAQPGASLLPTTREKKLLRRAVGYLPVGSIDLRVPLPQQPSETITTGDDITGH